MSTPNLGLLTRGPLRFTQLSNGETDYDCDVNMRLIDAAIAARSTANFNVLNYGAAGDGIVDGLQNQVDWTASAAGTGITATVTLSNNTQTFKSEDVGKVFTANAFQFPSASIYGTIVAVLGPNQAQVKGNFQNNSVNLSGGIVGWGTENTKAFQAASAAVQAAIGSGNGQSFGPTTASPTLYIPSGVYFLDLDLGVPITLNNQLRGFNVIGDGSEQTVLAIANTVNSEFGTVIQASQGRISGFTIEGMNAPINSGGGAMGASGILTDIRFQHCSALFCLTIVGNATVSTSLYCVANWNHGIHVDNADCDFYGCVLSNNGGMGLEVSASTGFCRWFGGLIDESGGTAAGANTNVAIDGGSQMVAFYNTQIFATNTPAVTVSEGSKAFFSNCNVTAYQGHGGLKIDATSQAAAVGSIIAALTFDSTPTTYALNNAGEFHDLGGNKIFLETPINEISESGSVGTIVLSGNHNCTDANIGDNVFIYGISDDGAGGYLGTWRILSVPDATTLTVQLGTTGLPSLNPPTGLPRLDVVTKFGGGVNGNVSIVAGAQNVYSFALAALTGSVTIGKFVPAKGNRLARITVTSTATTSSSAAPVLTLSNGNVSKTLVLATGQSSWDTGLLTDTYFAPGLSVTVSITQGTSVTPPANLNVIVACDSLGV